ncbi:MAG: hypothetical protein QOF83_1958 [Solirubrobacteraceae bacterium]|jgi:hypothetical protein|nr:hypothetical protein [Solirubrobacteraceae bacterium]
MLTRRTLALGSATVALLITPAGALAAGTTVTVRVEGAKRTLLATKAVHTHAGSITKDGAPKGSCPATNAVGAFNSATRGNWAGTYSSGLGLEVTKILGERHVYSPNGFYWGFWINNKFASQGICQQTLKKGDHLLFAPAPAKGMVHPTAIRAPRTASTTSAFKLRVVSYTDAGKAKPLGKARVSDGKSTAISNANGYITVHAQSAGKYHFTASEKGYIRSAAVTVKVS